MRRIRRLSAQEIQWVNESITKVCILEGLNPGDEFYRSAGWAAFMELYRYCRQFWSRDLWYEAYEQIAGAIRCEKNLRTSRIYRELSLNRPLNGESEETFLDLLPAKNGDFTNGVMFFDYIDRLPMEQQQLSRCILYGYTLEETRSRLRWTSRELFDTVAVLRVALLEYEAIR